MSVKPIRASVRRQMEAKQHSHFENSATDGSWKLSLPCTRAEAEQLHDENAALASMDPPPVLMTREHDDTRAGRWELNAYFEGRPDARSVALIQSLIPSARYVDPVLERLPDADWVTISQAGLDPVHAGRFYVQTSTSTAVPPAGSIRFIVDASRAFGTGGHATTAGCLMMLDDMKRHGLRFDHIADIGTGTGLLAFATNHLWPRAYVTASDIDPVSIDVAAGNADVNAVALGQQAGRVALCVASGTDHEMIARRAPYDLIIANILAGPLIELAPAIARIMRDGGMLVLAGLLTTQIDAVAAAYRAQGLRLAETRRAGDWPCLRLVKRPVIGWRRPNRASGRTSQAPGDFGAL
jgi:ribosomal protein L11 methyltransferase